MLWELSVVEQRYAAVQEVPGGMAVTAVADRYGVSRQSVHGWLRRYQAGGLAGLEDRFHRPRSCPHQASVQVEAQVCELRRQHPGWGPLRLQHELGRRGVVEVPSRAGIYRILVRHRLVERGRRRRRRIDWQRWEREAPMQLWQLTLLANRARKVAEGDGLPLYLVAIEELAYFTNGPDWKAAQAFSVLLRDFVARGRAAGMITVATTQKPSADVVPTYLRDLFGFRWALRCSTPEASDTILGRGWASQGYSAATIDPTARGVGLLLQEGGVPVRLRSCYLNDLDLADLARRAEQLRGTTGIEASTLWLLDGTA